MATVLRPPPIREPERRKLVLALAVAVLALLAALAVAAAALAANDHHRGGSVEQAPATPTSALAKAADQPPPPGAATFTHEHPVHDSSYDPWEPCLLLDTREIVPCCSIALHPHEQCPIVAPDATSSTTAPADDRAAHDPTADYSATDDPAVDHDDNRPGGRGMSLRNRMRLLVGGAYLTQLRLDDLGLYGDWPGQWVLVKQLVMVVVACLAGLIVARLFFTYPNESEPTP